MFISELTKTESIAFMNLLATFALTDSVVKKEEKALMDKYFKETNLSKDDLVRVSYEKSIEVIKSSSPRIIDIVYIELVRVGLIDGDYQIEEVEFLEKLTNDLEISRVKRLKIANFFYKFSDVGEKNENEMKLMAKELFE